MVCSEMEAALALRELMREEKGRILAGVKARDGREPFRREKESLDRKVMRAIRGMFERQMERTLNALGPALSAFRGPLSARKADVPSLDGLFDDPDEEAAGEILRLVLEAAGLGQETVRRTVGVSMDWTGVNARALEAARKYVYDLIKGINETTREAVRSVVSAFVRTPGMTMGDVVQQLPFDEARAWLVGTTEITRAYAQGQMDAAAAIRAEFPDLTITKTWFTNNDDLVCPVCGPLDGMEVGLDEEFGDGLEQPPAHPNCRCWMSTGAKA